MGTVAPQVFERGATRRGLVAVAVGLSLTVLAGCNRILGIVAPEGIKGAAGTMGAAGADSSGPGGAAGGPGGTTAGGAGGSSPIGTGGKAGAGGSGGAGGPGVPIVGSLQEIDLLAGELGGAGYADGTGSSARFNGPSGVVYVSAQVGVGSLFVADNGNDVIRKIDPQSGAVTTLAGSRSMAGAADGIGAAARFDRPSYITTDGNGLLFVSDSDQTIRQVVIGTGEVTTLAGSPNSLSVVDGVGAAATFGAPAGLATDGMGNLFVADSQANTIRKIVISTAAVTTFAGPARGSSGGANGTLATATFNRPTGLASDGQGNLFVTESGSQTVRQVAIDAGQVTTLAGTSGVQGSADGTGAAAQFYQPSDLAFDGKGNLFVTDSYNETIRKVVIATGEVTTVAGMPGVGGLVVDGMGSGARFDYPTGLTVGAGGVLFVTDGNNATIRQVSTSGQVSTLAGSPGSFGSADGTGASARLESPRGLASDGAGHAFVMDSLDGELRRLTIATGGVTTLPLTFLPAGDAGTSVGFALPRDIALDGAGSIVVADLGGIWKIAVSSWDVTTLAGVPNQPATSKDGTGSAARFLQLTAVVDDEAGNLFVADGSLIRQVSVATGQVTTIAGWSSAGSVDGSGLSARFNNPSGLALDGAGNLFVADTGNNTIRKVVLSTASVTTIAGSAALAGSADGTGLGALFNGPTALALDGGGNLFISDAGNSTLRKLVLGTGVVTTIAGVAGKARVTLGPLPGGLNAPRRIVIGPTGTLLLIDENSVLQIR